DLRVAAQVTINRAAAQIMGVGVGGAEIMGAEALLGAQENAGLREKRIPAEGIVSIAEGRLPEPVAINVFEGRRDQMAEVGERRLIHEPIVQKIIAQAEKPGLRLHEP